jgi:endonuclease-3
MPKRPAARRPKPSKPPAVARRIIHQLFTQHPNADTELHYSNPYELLVATILSAQCTDERVNQVTPALFRGYPNARALARATTDELEPQIQSTGFFRAKSRSLLGMSTEVVERHSGEIPKTMEELTALPGVGRKTANVVLGHALGVPGLPVDRHVLRVSNRIGIAKSDDPVIVEQQLNAALPPEEWTQASDTLILHGRRICKPRPLCDRCVVRSDCNYYEATQRAAVRRSPKTRSAAKARGAGKEGAILRQSHSESGSLTEVRRAPKAKGTRQAGASRQNRAESGKSIEVRRAPKAPSITKKGGPLPQSRPERGSLSDVRRAAKPRGTGRGGGAPRQTK